MHLLHPTIVHFAVALFVASMLCEALKLITGKRFWGLVAKYHILASAVAAFIAVLTGLIDLKISWMTDDGYSQIKVHMIFGLAVFILIQIMANYRFLLEKMLPPKLGKAYLLLGGFVLGLIFSTAHLGKVGVYGYGTGVSAAMINFDSTENYLKKLYSLDELPPLTAEDSLRALPSRPGADTLNIEPDSLAHSNTDHQANLASNTDDHNGR